MNKIVPFFERVLVKRIKYVAPQVTKKVGDIIIPTDSSKSYSAIKLGEVVDICESYENDDIKIGMTVILPEFGSINKFNYEGENLEMYKIDELLGCIKDGDI